MANRTLNGLPTILLSAAWVAGVPGYLFFSSGTVKPLYWILATVIWFGAIVLPRARDCWLLSTRLPIAWGLCYSLLLLWQFIQFGDPRHAIINHFEAIAVFFMAGYALLLHVDQRKYAQVGALAGVLISTSLNIAESLNLAEHLSPLNCLHPLHPLQASGLHGNPNISVLIIVLGLICSWNLVPKLLRSSYVLICLIGVGLTYSRGGWIMIVMAVTCLLVLDWSRSEDRVVDAVGLVVALFILFLCSDWLVSNICDHLRFGFEYKLKIFEGDLSDYSTQTRLTAMSNAFDQFLRYPILGGGFGSTTITSGVAGPHNMYLLYAAEMGIVGLGMYLWFILRIYKGTSGTARLLVIIYAVSGLFTHNNFETIAVMLLLAVAVADPRRSAEAGTAAVIRQVANG